MTKRLSSKLLAVILTLAICATTVLGCLMTVSADSNSLVTFTDGSTISPTNVTDATIELTIKLPETLPEGFIVTQDEETYGGIVTGTVALSYGSNLTLTGVKVDDGKKIVDGYTFDGEEFKATIADDKKSFLFEASNTDNVYYSQLTFELSFALTGAENGDKFSVTASSVNIGGAYDGTYEINTAVTGIIVAGCAHALVGNGTLIETDTVNGYSVYSGSVCSLCGTTFDVPQVVPTKLPGVIDTLVYYSSDAAATAAGSTDRYVDTKLDDDGETGSETDPIIIDSALELSYLTRYAGDATKDKYYKVADGISGFDMSGGKINFDGSLDENFDAITGSGKRHDAGETYFQGHFDGNGATVYGLWNKYDEENGPTPSAAGLFAYAKGNVTIENINVSLSYFKAKSHAGGIVGAYSFDTAIGANDGNKLTIERCSVTDCHIETSTADSGSYAGTGGMVAATGAIYGAARCYSGDWNGVVKVSNCFINLDEAHFVSLGETDATVNSIHGGIGGVAVSQKATFDNCVVIGIAPYSVYNTEYTPNGNNHQHTFLKGRFSNIYTTAAVTGVASGGASDNCKTQDYTGLMYQISASQIKGAAAAENMDLDWDVWEVDVNRGYPNFAQAKTDNVSETSDYELKLIGTNITYNNGGDYNFNFYYRPNKTETGNNYEPVLYVAQLNDNTVNTDGATLGSFHRLTGTPLDAAAAAAVDGLQEGDICYTLERLSAREIYNTLLATAVDVQDGKALYGGTAEISIADYAEDVVAGEAFYNDDATEDEKTADKNVAEAVLKYGKASAKALNTKNDAASGTTIHWNGGTDSDLTNETHDYSTQTGDAANPIIIDTAEELAYLVQRPYAETQGKYYKIADGISNIVLQKEEHDNGIMQLPSQSKVEEYFENSANSKTRWVTNYNYNTPTELAFYGNFDGNGATVYGLYGINGADSLFGAVMAPAVIKNLTVKNCYIGGTNFGAFISSCVTLIAETSEEKNKNNYITFENIEISNCRMEVTTVGNKNVGLLSGTHGSGANVTINNLLVYGCEIFNTTDNTVCTRLSGQTGWNNAATGIKNSVILDCSITDPYNATLTDGTGREIYNYVNSGHTVENVYSSCPEDATRAAIFSKKITYITNEQAMGMDAITNMPNLDWSGTWCYGTTYPSLAKGTYTSASSGKTLYWDGTAAAKFYADTDGATADNPIIIDTAEELAYVATATYDNTYGKYFEIADDIDKIVLQSQTYYEDIIALDSAEAVKDYFEPIIASDISNSKATLHRWLGHTWNPATMCFAGNFDGNGVEIYGMYNTTSDVNSTIVQTYGGNSGGGLFSVAEGATISNLAIKNSYTNIGAMSKTWQFGLIVSYGKDKDGDSSACNVIHIDRCTVANNYIYRQDETAARNAGIICGGNEYGPVIMQNCLVYGNSAKGLIVSSSTEYNLPLIGYATKPTATDEYKAAHPEWVNGDGYMETVLENSVVLGNPLLATDAAGTTIIYSTWCVLSAINSGNNCFKNVYTDWDVSKITDVGNFKKDFFLANCGEVVNASDLIGDTAKANEIVSTFNTANNDTVWYTGNGVLLGFNPPTEMLASAQAAYDAITFKTVDDYGENNKTFGVYATSLNLKTNPYISFAFAFSGEYKSNRDKIEVTFKYTVDGTPTTKEVWVANESGALLDGWSNSSNDRFHIYRFQDIPVEALCSPITVTVAYNGEEKVTTGTFSVEGFGCELVNAYKKAPCTYYETRIEAVKALLFYTQMLQARYGTTA